MSPDPWELLEAIVATRREIIGGLVEAGCRYVYIDAPGFTAYVDEPALQRLRARDFDPRELRRSMMEAENGITSGFPDVTFGIHLCSGNQHGQWHRERPYADVAEELFTGLARQRLLLGYDTERAGSFAPLRLVPRGQTRRPRPWDQGRARRNRRGAHRRVDEAAKYLDLDRIAISPRCGFESNGGGAQMTTDEQWRKLDVLMQIGRDVWG